MARTARSLARRLAGILVALVVPVFLVGGAAAPARALQPYVFVLQ